MVALWTVCPRALPSEIFGVAVLGLGSSVGPAAIARLLVTGAIYSVDRHAAGAFTHVIQEIFEIRAISG